MNFKQTFHQITTFFENKNIGYALIGAFALQAYGHVRATRDLDIIVNAEHQTTIITYLESLGYETLHQSEGFSNHLHPDAKLGRVDFVYVSGQTAEKLFQETRHLPLFESRSIPVVSPEHMAALKIFAMKNNPDRALQDMADIKFLLSLPDIDVNAVKSYFEKYGQIERFHEFVDK